MKTTFGRSVHQQSTADADHAERRPLSCAIMWILLISATAIRLHCSCIMLHTSVLAIALPDCLLRVYVLHSSSRR
jgi:hypothetical protein